MAFYKRDWEYEKAKKLIENLGDSDDEKLIKYYIKKNKQYLEELRADNKDYQEFFQKLNQLLPNNNKLYK